MLVHIVIISIQCAAVAAFLLLWYFWARKKIETSYLLEDEEQILFPFRYFSWVLMAVILATSLAQIHFVRTSAQLNDKIAAVIAQNKIAVQQTKSFDELKVLVEKIKRDMDGNFKSLRVQLADKGLQTKSLQTIADLSAASDKSDKEAFLRTEKPRADYSAQPFAKEARASSAASSSTKTRDGDSDEQRARELSMGLSRQGKILRDQVRVRQKPSLEAPPVDKLMSGQHVKVTEKKLDLDGKIWFRVITPTGRAGWVDWRFVKLEPSN
ncbi:MAG: SH3 domain-containing protein [Desulfomonilaceae bacterium]